jgi:hypothetical protein
MENRFAPADEKMLILSIIESILMHSKGDIYRKID